MICFVMTSWPQPRQSVDLPALVVGLREADAVRLRGRRSGRGVRRRAHASSPPFSRPGAWPGRGDVVQDSVDHGRRVEGEAVVLADGDEARRELGELVAQDRDELPVAVLLDDVDRARGSASSSTASADERQGAEAAVVERDAERRRELVAGLRRAVVRRAVGEEPRSRARTRPGTRASAPSCAPSRTSSGGGPRCGRSPGASRSTAPVSSWPEPRVK